MTQLFGFEAIVGKTVGEVRELHGILFLVFEDGTFLAIDDEYTIMDEGFGLQGKSIETTYWYALEEALLLKEITQEQADARIEQRNQTITRTKS